MKTPLSLAFAVAALAAVHTHAAPALMLPHERPTNDLAQRRGG